MMWSLLIAGFKFIGIFILILLCLLLLILLLILAVPIKCQVACAKNEKTSYCINIMWLFGLVRFKVNNGGTRLKLLWWSFGRRKRKASGKDRCRGDTKASGKRMKREKSAVFKWTDKKTGGFKTDKKAKETHKDSRKEKKDKGNGIFNIIKYVWSYPDRDLIIKHTINLFKRLLKAVRFEEGIIDGTVGFDRPDMTGYLLAAAGIIQTILPFDINIRGDFEKEILQGKVSVKGSVILWFVFWPVIVYTLIIAKIIIFAEFIPKVTGKLRYAHK